MSSRVLKKLHGENDLEDGSDLDNDNSIISSSGARKKQFDGNRYDLVIFFLVFLCLFFTTIFHKQTSHHFTMIVLNQKHWFRLTKH